MRRRRLGVMDVFMYGKTLIIILILLVLFTLLCLAEVWRELHSFQVKRYQLSRKFSHQRNEKIKIAFLSDLHNHSYGKENQELLEAIRVESPDLILIGGDMIVAKHGHAKNLVEDFMEALPAIAPVYFANGNHEQRMKEYPEDYPISYGKMKEDWEKAGIHFLSNSSEMICIKGRAFRLYGLELPDLYYHHHKRPFFDLQKMESLLGAPDSEDAYKILLAHNPSFMDTYLSWGADLILSGHMHGGIVRIPGFRGVISTEFHLFPKYSGGFYQEKGKDILVSCGLGTHTIPFRFLNPAELLMIEL